jgi:hypothetical protein
MTLFMLTEQVDPLEIHQLVEWVKEAEAKGTQALKKKLALDKEVLTLKRNYNNSMNKVKQLKSKAK